MADRNVTPARFALTPGLVILVIGLVLVGGLLLSSFYVVDQTEQAVITTFGRYTATEGPGLHFKLPFGIQKNFNVKTTLVQSEEFGFRTEELGIATRYSDQRYPEESSMLTGDLNIVDVEWTIEYRINDPKAWMFHADDRHKTIRDISQSVINLLVGDRAILDVIASQRSAIEYEGMSMMNEILGGYDMGVEIVAVQLQNTIPPAGVQTAFEDVNMAIRDMNRLINEGKEAYNREIPRARGQADAIVQVARGYASERVNRANGDVARFNSVFEEYRRAPAITRERLYYEMIEAIFVNESNIELIDDNLGNVLPLLNLGGGATGVRP